MTDEVSESGPRGLAKFFNVWGKMRNDHHRNGYIATIRGCRVAYDDLTGACIYAGSEIRGESDEVPDYCNDPDAMVQLMRELRRRYPIVILVNMRDGKFVLFIRETYEMPSNDDFVAYVSNFGEHVQPEQAVAFMYAYVNSPNTSLPS